MVSYTFLFCYGGKMYFEQRHLLVVLLFIHANVRYTWKYVAVAIIEHKGNIN